MSGWSVRDLGEADYALIREVFYSRYNAQGEALGLLWYEMTDVSTIMAALRCGTVQSKIVDGYLVCYQVVTPWYSNRTVVSECLVLNLYGGRNFRAVPEFLSLEAEAHGADYVSCGTALATHPKALQRMYERNGFTVQATELLRKV